ncbi:hypothetical protein UA08_09267 [Talaromyces atroroseus]|uniref:FAD-binding PCMH-type domain-containing protein n=1 Tax=Talaromyces atroroseus TaxID=1441469 RepID=A0A1Q5Q6E5_TALAT|nr:hypothetical protein UA08_09267 [Talaromyces atroroseus]OKL55414.1 hypothetical protein UA08_09267 [Talaromyces atroroseus]
MVTSVAVKALLLAAASLPFTDLAQAQTIRDGNQTVAANATTVAPGAADVSPDSADSGVSYFSFESTQLTPEVIANLTALNLTGIEYFTFGNASSPMAKRDSAGCKVLPGDAAWPSEIDWFLLDLLLGGALIKGVPVAAPCYSNWHQYNADECTTITSDWNSSDFHASQPTGIDWPLFEGVTCLPPTLAPTNATCTLGGMPSYIVNVTNVAQIQLAFNFARSLNLRLSVKNQGHDFNAKNVGAGSLSVWTKHLNEIQYLGPEFTIGSYKGPALKIGSGVDTLQAYEYADALGLEVVGGISTTVGLGGGYIAGGGHSPLISMYGMAADQVLSMEVVLPDGRFVSVSETSYPDLFWALRGGGGSTFGVVTSLVIRAYPKLPVTTLTFSFGTSENVTNNTFWEGMDAVWATFPAYADAGHYRYWTILCASESSCSFTMSPHWANNCTSAQLQEFVDPLFANLTALGMAPEDVVYTEFDGVLNAFTSTFPASSEAVGTWSYHTGSRLFPRGNWENATALAAQSAAIRNAAIEAGMMMGYNIKAAVNPTVNQTNAVNPAWRDTLMHGMLGAVWTQTATPEDIAAANQVLTERLQTWRDVSPGSGAYMNEADINEPDFQQSFYGSNYPQLYAMKQQYDPWGVLYAITAVGSEDWYVTDQIPYYPTQNGRLCRVEN